MNKNEMKTIRTNSPVSGEVGEVVYEQPGDGAVLMSVVVREEGLPADEWQTQYIRHVLSPDTPHSLQIQTRLKISLN
jgi:hypothetical protein